MKKWEIHNNTKLDSTNIDSEKLTKILLENRGIKTKKEIEEYLNPDLKSLTADALGINKKDLEKSLLRVKKAIKNCEHIIIFGDYDVDGIAGSAVLWESLNSIGANVMPYIPHRVEEGYGLSVKGIESVLEKYPETKIIITVDNGIVAQDAVDFANSKGLEVIVTDHHAPGKKLPKAFAIIHSTKTCGAAVGWFFSQQLSQKSNDHLGLVALATVADVMSLSGFNRTLVIHGLKELRKTKRPGLIELLKLAGVDQDKVGIYEIGHIIGPRLNAMGRIEHAMDSLRFLCTPNLTRARELANTLHITNKDRQQLTVNGVLFAKKSLEEKKIKKFIFVSDKSLQPGIIGLVAGRLTEEFYRPSIVISEGAQFSKGSARSVAGFNIIEFIREFSDLLVDKGGHPMAAGFTVRSEDIEKLKKLMIDRAEKEISESLLVRKLKIDCGLPIEFINLGLFENINRLSPFGYGNPEPTFLAKAKIFSMRLVGAEKNHLKLTLSEKDKQIEGIAFGVGDVNDIKIGDSLEFIYSISVNEWNGNKRLELKIKDWM